MGRFLLDRDAHMDLDMEDGNALVHLTVRGFGLKFVRASFNASGNTDAQNNDGKTRLEFAIESAEDSE
jgi:hypothetical protein